MDVVEVLELVMEISSRRDALLLLPLLMLYSKDDENCWSWLKLLLAGYCAKGGAGC